MHSSTSSSRAVPPVNAGAIIAALTFSLLVVVAMEWVLAAKGYEATAIDSEALWVQQRARASRLGADAIILLGASRMQLDVDTATLRRLTGLEPVQLAIDGSSFVPILEGLARDPAIQGTIIIDYGTGAIIGLGERDAASVHQEKFERDGLRNGGLPDFRWSEDALTASLRSRMRSYSDGAKPVDTLLWRVLTTQAEPQYLSTRPDRSRLADYQRVEMPEFYFRRVAHDLGDDAPISGRDDASIAASLTARVEAVAMVDDRRFIANAPRIGAAVRTIESRGGRVLFVVMPMSGLIRRLDDRRFPRQRFFDRFIASQGLRGMDVRDDQRVSKYVCPDGSHLDRRDRTAFTRDLVSALALDSSAPATTFPAAATPAGPAAPTRSP